MGLIKSIGKRWMIYGAGWRNAARNRSSIRNARLLIINLNSLGDAATMVPTAHALRQQGFAVDIVCLAALEPLWHEFLAGSSVMPIKLSGRYDQFFRAFAGQLGQREYEAVFCIITNKFAVFLSSCPLASRRLGMTENGWRFQGKRIIFDRVYYPKKNEHVYSRLQNLVSLYVDGFSNDIEQFKGLFQYQRQDYVAIHAGGKWKPRRWPVARFFQLATSLSEMNLESHILIGPGEDDLLACFQAARLPQAVKVIQVASLNEMLNELKYCRLFIGNDSGPAHVANLYNTVTLVLWGPGNPHRIAPQGDNIRLFIKEIECRPCQQYINPLKCTRGENLCLQMITADEVIQAVQTILT